MNESRHPTTTNAGFGEGRPRLIFRGDSRRAIDAASSEFELLDPVTRIGSGDGMDLRLDGLEPLQAEIRHDDDDEYVLFLYGPAGLSSELVTPSEEVRPEGRPLRTGSRVDLGDWELSYYRAEYADHGRPFGGREGGEGEHQSPQNSPRAHRDR